jgi:large subunit ribosomal protein L24|tara:strand:+ start:3101 stop:3343 length:243 start_codon:yes stop_codon:yes gene_type:complete
MVQTIKMSIKLGDTVEVITGFEKKKTGKVIKLFRSTGKILIQGINLKFKHVKPTKEGDVGEIKQIEAPIHHSNVKVNKKK